MNASQIRSLPVQAGLTIGLFASCVILGGIIVSQRWRFESFIQERYAASSAPVSSSTTQVTESLLKMRPAKEKWTQVPESERRNVYLALMRQDDFPSTEFVAACQATDPEFFVTCAERTVVCGNDVQRDRGLKFLELAGIEQSGPALDRLVDWASRWHRSDDHEAIERVRARMKEASPATTNGGAEGT